MVVSVLDCDIVVNEFELQSPYLRLFLDKYLWERHETLNPILIHGLISACSFLVEEWLWH